MSESKVPVTDLLIDPSAHFPSPADVVKDGRLSTTQKRRVLDAWEADSRQLAVAAEEGMGGGEPARMDEVKAAKSLLEGGAAASADSPTKSG